MARGQGDQIGRIFAYWAIFLWANFSLGKFFFGRIFLWANFSLGEIFFGQIFLWANFSLHIFKNYRKSPKFCDSFPHGNSLYMC
jgi:hypothetical protein